MVFDKSHTRYHMSWADVEASIARLIKDIKERKAEPPTRIIGVAKGGVIPASLVHQAFPNAEFAVIHTESYMDGEKRTPRVRYLTTSQRWMDWNTNRTLIVDDICDSGDTFKLLHQYLPEANYAAMLVRQDTEEEPNEYYDYLGDVVEKGIWVEFPWEPLTD